MVWVEICVLWLNYIEILRKCFALHLFFHNFFYINLLIFLTLKILFIKNVINMNINFWVILIIRIHIFIFKPKHFLITFLKSIHEIVLKIEAFNNRIIPALIILKLIEMTQFIKNMSLSLRKVRVHLFFKLLYLSLNSKQIAGALKIVLILSNPLAALFCEIIYLVVAILFL